MEIGKTQTAAPAKTAASHRTGEGVKEMPLLEGSGLMISPKLSIGSPDDPLEHEADAMADKVMRMQMPESINFSFSKNSINRKCADCEEEEKEKLQRKESGNQSVSMAPPIVHDVINSSSGRALDDTTRSFMEPRFNYDFSNVKIHDDNLAAKSANSINALAYTSGNNIVFNSGQYNTTSDSGKRLLAHELTHVVQQQEDAIRRKKLTEEEKKEDLQSDRLKNDPRLQQAFDQSPSMQWGENSEGVKTLQRALKDLGYDLTISFQKTGDADGIYQNETRSAVKKFQSDNSLDDDGVVGRDTLRALDSKFIVVPPTEECHINYAEGQMDEKRKTSFLAKNFTDADRPSASKILDDLCAVKTDMLNFGSEGELKDEVQKRLLTGKYMQESQTSGAFAYPENAKPGNCPGAIGNALSDAKVNKAAKDYWIGPILETRPQIRNQHYYFELSALGKDDAYNALKLLFTPQANICDRTLIHCDTLITLVNILVYAETIGVPVFNAKVKGGLLGIWLTYDGLSAIENDTTPTAPSTSLRSVIPANEDDLVIGDHVVFWNHQAYDAISVTSPGPWRLENAILVKKASNGDDLFEGHGAPAVSGLVQPGTKKDVHTELMNAYNPYAKQASDLANKADNGDTGASATLATQYPQVFKNSLDSKWYVKELDRNSIRPRTMYELREITDPLDPEIIGLRDPLNATKMSNVHRPLESF